MKLSKDTYLISRATLEKAMAALTNNHTRTTGDGGEDNNDDIIEAEAALLAEVRAQETVDARLADAKST